MPRLARKKSAINLYHIVTRGLDHQLMFEEHYDYLKYLNILKRYKEELNFEIYAYCLMNNHIHLLIQVNDNSLENIFRHINTNYSVWFNMKYSRTGYLLQGRYHSEPIDSFDYLINAIRYIHQNPLKSGLETIPGENYRYSSMYDYIHNIDDIVSPSHINELFGSYDNFFEFHKTNETTDYMDIHNIKRRLPDDVARQIIIDICNCSTTMQFQALSYTKQKDYVILLNKKGISVRQLNRLTGIPKGLIVKFLNKNK